MPSLSARFVRVVFTAATISIAVFIAYQSTRPAGDPTVPVLKSWLSYAGHFGVYAVLAFCAMVIIWRSQMPLLAGVIIACSAFGLVLEIYQGSIEGRESTPMDALSNVIGSALGAGVAYAALPLIQAKVRQT